jgi:hypothetical protein
MYQQWRLPNTVVNYIGEEWQDSKNAANNGLTCLAYHQGRVGGLQNSPNTVNSSSGFRETAAGMVLIRSPVMPSSKYPHNVGSPFGCAQYRDVSSTEIIIQQKHS